MRQILAIGDRRLAGLRAAGVEVLDLGPDEAAVRVEGAAADIALLILGPDLVAPLAPVLARHPRLIWTVASP